MNIITTGVLATVLAVSGAFVAFPSAASAATAVDWTRTATGYFGGQITVEGSCATGSGCERTKTNVGVLGTNATRTKTTTYSGPDTYTKTVNVTGSNWTFTRIVY